MKLRDLTTRRPGGALIVLIGSVAAFAVCTLAMAAPASIQATVSVPAQLSLASVSCVRFTDCVAVGQRVTTADTDLTFAENWNGHRWRLMPIPNPAPDIVLNGVSCATGSDCMVVGDYFGSSQVVHPVAEVWNGMTWRLVLG
jgi:hypothetical protein